MHNALQIMSIANRQIRWHYDMILAQEQIIKLALESITPPEMTVTPVSERSSPLMDFLKYRATFPALPVGSDIQSQLFDVSANGEGQPTQTLGIDAASAEFEVPQGATVEIKLTYVDDGGNLSQPRLQSFVAQDTIPPEAPGEFGAVDLIGERSE